MKTQFMHIMTESHGGVTLALRRTELENCAVQYEVGAAFASPSEHQFDRKKGRLIAEGRLEARRHGYALFTRDETSKKDSITKAQIPEVLRMLRTKPRRGKDILGPDWYPKFLAYVGA